MVSFYAAAIGVMFLLFTASSAGGSLLDEAESGTLDRVLSSRVTMGTSSGRKTRLLLPARLRPIGADVRLGVARFQA